MSQTVFRARDREVLSQFFAERLRTLDGFDPLRRLRRWSGLHQLTNHALRMLEDERAEPRVRAGIRAANPDGRRRTLRKATSSREAAASAW